MKIIDSHVHVLEKSIGEFKGSVDDLKNDMKKSGVSKSIILAGEGPHVDFKKLIELCEKDERFELVYTVNPNNDLRKEENYAKLLFEKGQIKGLKFLLGYDHVYPDDKKFEPFYKLCEKYDLPVIFHTGDTLAGVVDRPKLKYSHPLNIDSLAVDRPNLKIIIAHIGNPWIIDAAEVIYKNKNVYGDISGFFLNKVDKDYEKWVLGKINEFIVFAGGDKLLFGTDFPLIGGKEYIDFTKKLNLDKDDLERLFYKNAEELFKLK